MSLNTVPSFILSTFRSISSPFFFFNDTATTEIYTLSLHDALPIYVVLNHGVGTVSNPLADDREGHAGICLSSTKALAARQRDRKSTRLNSSHGYISYAVFCLKKKKMLQRPTWRRTVTIISRVLNNN